MNRLIHTACFAVLLGGPAGGSAQTVDQVVDQMVRADNAGLNDIDNYLLKTSAMGMTNVEYFEKESSLELDNGTTVYVMRRVPSTEIQRRQSDGNAMSDASPADLERAANTIEQAGTQMEAEMRREMESAGLPGGIGTLIMNPPPDEPWLSPNPRDMTRNYATMLRAAAEGKRQEATEDPAAAIREMQEAMALIKGRSSIAGRETVDGRAAIILEAPDLNDVQQIDENREFTARSIRLAVDAAKSVPLRMQIDGLLREGSETRPMTIVREDSDYRSVPGCGDLYKPFRSVMRIEGMMNAEEQAQMREAKAQMADLDEKLKDVPEAQREMVMRQMAPQLKMMESMAAGGGMEFESRVVELRCNAGLPDTLEIAQSTFGGGPATAAGGGAIITRGETRTDRPVDAEQACLQEKIAAAEAAKKKKRGFGSLMSAVGRTASRLGNAAVGKTIGDINSANATVDDLSSAARDLGITDDEIVACRQDG